MAKKSKKITVKNVTLKRSRLIFISSFAIVGVVLTITTLAAPRARTSDLSVSPLVVEHGGTVTATTSTTGNDIYVFAQCYSPGITGKYVYAAYFLVENGTATLGPLTSTQWPNSDGACTADLGYFTRSGFGKWVSYSKTNFSVTAK